MNLETYLMIKQSGTIGDWVETNISRPVYDKLFGQGSYNDFMYTSLPRNRNTDYSKTNPNISEALAARASYYRNRGGHDAIPIGGVKYMSASDRRRATENALGTVLPKTNEGAPNVTSREYSKYYNGQRIRKPRRLEPRKRSIEDYYDARKANLNRRANQARARMKTTFDNNRFDPTARSSVLDSALHALTSQAEAAKEIEKMDADLARRQQLRQQAKRK